MLRHRSNRPTAGCLTARNVSVLSDHPFLKMSRTHIFGIKADFLGRLFR